MIRFWQPLQNRLAAVPAAAWWALAAAAVLWMALAGNWPRVDSPETNAMRWEDIDTQTIYREASRTTSRDMLRWWTGRWIQREQPFYRPLISHIFYLEYRLFDREYAAYCRVTTVFHAINALLILWLASQLLTGPLWRRAALGVAAVAGFCGPWGNLSTVSYVLSHWAPQTDVVSLTLGLSSLGLLLAYLRSGRAWALPAALVVFVAGLLVKEMAVLTAVAAVLLAWHMPRRRLRVWLGYGLLTVIFLVWRRAVLPIMNYHFSGWLDFRKAGLLAATPLKDLVSSAPSGLLLWPEVGGLLALGLAVWLLRRGVRPPLVAGAALGVAAASALILAEHDPAAALYLAVSQLPRLVAVAVFATGCWALAVRFREWPLAALALTFLASVWIILPYPVAAPHYQYWVSAFWGLLQAAMLLPIGVTMLRWSRGQPG